MLEVSSWWKDGWEGIRQRALAPVSVAVLDTGIDGSHPDLLGRVAGAFAVELEDGKPMVRELSPTANNDAFGHGTSVAGIIATIAPNAQIYDVRVLGNNIGTTEVLLTGFRHALDQPWRLLNLSLAAEPSIRQRFIDLCERAYYQEKIVVAARRNLPLDDEGLPAELSSCIGVDIGDYPTPFDYVFRACTPIEFEARGESVVCPARGGGYTTWSGTSFATPTVSGLCALLLGAFPQLKLFEIKTALRQLAKATKNEAEAVK
jgi:subtilisin family serine protease